VAKKITKVLPPGILVFPSLNAVDVYQPVDKKGKPSGAEKRRFLTRVKFDDDSHRKVDAWLMEIAKEAGVEDGKLPWKKNSKNGEITLFAASGEDYPPLLVDAKNRKLPKGIVIGGGTKARVSVSVNVYDGFGGGINLYLNGVQVLDLKEGGYKSPFEEEEGYSAPDEDEAAPTQPFNPHSDMDDDIPF
jgi:hypothetical protein